MIATSYQGLLYLPHFVCTLLREPRLCCMQTAKGADQPAHPRCPISAYKLISSRNLINKRYNSTVGSRQRRGGGVELLLEIGSYQFFF